MCTYDAGTDTILWCDREHDVSTAVLRASERQTQAALAESRESVEPKERTTQGEDTTDPHLWRGNSRVFHW